MLPNESTADSGARNAGIPEWSSSSRGPRMVRPPIQHASSGLVTSLPASATATAIA